MNKNIQLVAEMLSISDDVDSAVNQIYNEIEKNYSKHPSKKDANGLFCSQWASQIILWDIPLELNITAYYFTNQNLFDSIAGDFQCHNDFNKTNGTLDVTVIMLHGFIYRPLADTSLEREIKNIYRYYKVNLNNPKTVSLKNSAYNRALAVINRKNQDLSSVIAMVLYYSNPHKQDAFVHEYYTQARRSGSDFINNATEVENRFKWYRDKVNWLNANINNPKVTGIISQYSNYGFNTKNFLTYANKGVNRFKNKLNHVRALVSPMYNTRVEYNETTHPSKSNE